MKKLLLAALTASLICGQARAGEVCEYCKKQLIELHRKYVQLTSQALTSTPRNRIPLTPEEASLVLKALSSAGAYLESTRMLEEHCPEQIPQVLENLKQIAPEIKWWAESIANTKDSIRQLESILKQGTPSGKEN